MRAYCVVALLISGASAELGGCVTDPDVTNSCREEVPSGDIMSLLQHRGRSDPKIAPKELGACAEDEDMKYGDDCPKLDLAELAAADKKGKASLPHGACCVPRCPDCCGKKVESVGGLCRSCMCAPDPEIREIGACAEDEEMKYGDDCPKLDLAELAAADKKGKTSLPYGACCVPRGEPPKPRPVGGCPEGEKLAYGADCPLSLTAHKFPALAEMPKDSCCVPEHCDCCGEKIESVGGLCPSCQCPEPEPRPLGACAEYEEMKYGDDCPKLDLAELAAADKKGKTSLPHGACCVPKMKILGGCAGTQFGCCPEASWHPGKAKPGPNKPKDTGCYYYDLE